MHTESYVTSTARTLAHLIFSSMLIFVYLILYILIMLRSSFAKEVISVVLTEGSYNQSQYI